VGSVSKIIIVILSLEDMQQNGSVVFKQSGLAFLCFPDQRVHRILGRIIAGISTYILQQKQNQL